MTDKTEQQRLEKLADLLATTAQQKRFQVKASCVALRDEFITILSGAAPSSKIEELQEAVKEKDEALIHRERCLLAIESECESSDTDISAIKHLVNEALCD